MLINIVEIKLPVMNTFWSCPLRPVRQGFTDLPALLLKKKTPVAKRRRRTPPVQPTTIGAMLFEELLRVWIFGKATEGGGAEETCRAGGLFCGGCIAEDLLVLLLWEGTTEDDGGVTDATGRWSL